MYNDDRGPFNLIGVFVKILFFIVFIILLVLIFPTKKDINNLNNSVYRENISYMGDSAKNYFTTDLLPTEEGKSTKITLKEMLEKHMILPINDIDGNVCDYNKSYAEVRKENGGYILKTSLTCNGETNYIEQKLGCYDYGCGSCNEKVAIEYEFQRTVSKNVTKYSCSNGYTLKGSYCYKTVNAKKNYTKARTEITDALYNSGKDTKVLVNTIVKTEPDVTTKKSLEVVKTVTGGEEYYISLTPVRTVITGESYDCSTTKKVCKDVKSSEPYSCNCTTKYKNGAPVTTCSTCYRTVTKQVCSNEKVEKTCKYDDTIKYSCPSTATTSTGSGSSLKCYKKEKTPETTTYSCPSGTDVKEGSGSSLKCYKLVVTKGTTTYSCPADSTSSEGTGSNLKCYKTIKGTGKYYCKDSEATLNEKTHKCTKTIAKEFSHYSCPDNSYTLNGSVCTKSTTDKVAAKATKTTKKSVETKWSTEESIEGWERTGNTRTK